MNTEQPFLFYVHILYSEHFLFNCAEYRTERMFWFQQLNLPEGFETFSDGKKLKTVLNEPSNIKATSQYIVNAFNLRGQLIK